MLLQLKLFACKTFLFYTSVACCTLVLPVPRLFHVWYIYCVLLHAAMHAVSSQISRLAGNHLACSAVHTNVCMYVHTYICCKVLLASSFTHKVIRSPLGAGVRVWLYVCCVQLCNTYILLSYHLALYNAYCMDGLANPDCVVYAYV